MIYEDGVYLDDEVVDTTNLSEQARHQLLNIKFVDELILQKSNELQIADSARLMYTSVLKSVENKAKKTKKSTKKARRSRKS